MAPHYPDKRKAWVYIIISGILGTAVYVGLNAFLSPDDMTILEMLVQAVFFFTIWLMVQALLNRRRYKN